MFNQNGGTRTDTLVKLVLVFFLSLLSFSVGTFVGKQFSDSQHKIADLENNSGDVDRSTASIPPDATKAEPAKAITDEEVTKLSDEFINKEKSSEEKQAPVTPPDSAVAQNEGSKGMTGSLVAEEKEEVVQPKKAVPAKKTVSVRDEIANVSKRIAAGGTVAAPKAPTSRIPSSLPKELANSSIGKYTVQLSSHSSEDEAKSKAQNFKDKGFSAFYVPAPVNGKTWYRVSVGLFDTRKEASQYMEKLKKEAGVASAIVQKISK